MLLDDNKYLLVAYAIEQHSDKKGPGQRRPEQGAF